MNLFYGRMKDAEQISNKEFVGGVNNKSVLNIGDYVFINNKEEGGNGVNSIWKVENYQKDDDSVKIKFSELFKFDIISLEKFRKLKIFKIEQNLVVFTHRQAKDQSFFKLDLSSNFNENFFSDAESFKTFISNEENYRKIQRLNSEADIVNDSDNIQVYFKENSYNIFLTDRIYAKVFQENYKKDNYKIFKKNYKENGSDKCKTFKFLEENVGEPTVLGLYDLFLGDFKTI